MPSTSSSSCTVPSSPSRAVQRDERDVGRRVAQPGTRSWPTSIGTTSWPSASSASCTRAPDRSETLALQRPPALQDRDAAHRATPADASSPRRAVGQAQHVRRRRGLGRRRGRGAARAPGERPVERDLLAHDLADAPHALEDVVVADAREVQPHRRAAAAVEVRGAAGDERDVLLQRAGEQVGRVDVVGQRRPQD